MQYTIKKFFIIPIVAFLFLNFNCNNKKGSNVKEEGVITYEVSYPDLSGKMAKMKRMLPKKMIVSYKGHKSRTESKGGMAMSNSTTIFNNKDMQATTLINMMGKKLAMDMDSSQIKKQMNAGRDYDIKVTDETKKIAGYKCKKAIITDKKSGDKFTSYFTDEVKFNAKNLNNPYGDAIDGTLLKFEVKRPRFTMKMEAKNLEFKSVSDSLFQIPDDYKKVTREEFQKMMQQQRGMGR